VLEEALHQLGEVAEARIPRGAEHSHEALGLLAQLLRESLNSQRGVAVVTQKGFSDVTVFLVSGMG
jgi:hypothetical protein